MDDKIKSNLKSEYSIYLDEINYIMHNLEHERIYEKTGWTQDGYLATNIGKLRDQLNHLLNAIQKYKLGVEEPEKLFQSYE